VHAPVAGRQPGTATEPGAGLRGTRSRHLDHVDTPGSAGGQSASVAGMEPQEPTPAAPPGWYPDNTGQTRWWDGQQWGQTSTPVPAPPTAPVVAQGSGTDPRTMAMLCHLLAIFTGFLGPLIIYLINGDKDPFVRHHAAESLNFQITVTIAVIVSAVLILVLVGLLLLPIIWIGALVFEIIGAIRANKGEWWKYPINIRMVPGAVG
jgi:uncharacterized Tic20 family protein